jgi:hypothetical protein
LALRVAGLSTGVVGANTLLMAVFFALKEAFCEILMMT